jgi:ketosteroid isomerase-like protein
MSANLDLVRSIYAAWERGDFSSAEWADPEIEFEMADGFFPGRWVGLAEMAVAWRGVLSAWHDLRAEAEDYRVLDDERVLALDHRSGRGKVSGVELAHMPTQGGTVWQVRNGKVTRLIIYYDRDRALADLGLEDG